MSLFRINLLDSFLDCNGRILEIAGLLPSSRVGREVVWGLKPGQVEGVRGYLGRICAEWDRALARLRA